MQRYGPTMGFEEHEEVYKQNDTGSSQNGVDRENSRERQVTISEDNSGTPLITFKAVEEQDDLEL